jgi:predicted helicase
LFKEVDEELFESYQKGINPLELFKVNVMGFQTHRDSFAVDFDRNNILSRAFDLRNKEISNEEIYKKYSINDNRDWKLDKARFEITNDQFWENKIINCGYRPFDNRPCYFSYVMMDYPRKELIQNILNKENLLIGIGRQGLAVGDIDWCLTTVSRNPVDANVFRRGGVNLFPLYLYSDSNSQQSLLETSERVPNLNMEIINKIAEHLSCEFIPDDNITVEFNAIDFVQPLCPLNILDYIYAVLHSPKYRETYKEFLKIDFPRIPYPTDADKFWKLVELGAQIRELHLLESPLTENYITGYPEDGDNIVTKPVYKNGNVYINETQYFSDVSELAWNFYIGGYQPAQKWLKDRKERELSYEDILHYQKIIVALTETDRLMKEVDKVGGY